VRRVPRIAAGIIVGSTAGLLAALALAPGSGTTAAGVYLIVLVVVALASLSRALVRSSPGYTSEFERALQSPRPATERVRELTRVENDVIHGTETEGDFRRRLRPLLRELAADRLSARRGIELDRDHVRAREAIGDEAWAVVRPDFDTRHYPRGLSRAQLRGVVDRLEKL
jgi:hypothetical protein